MKYSSFEQIAQVCRGKEGLKRVAVAGAADQHVLQAVIEAHKEGIAEPVLVGDPERIAEELSKLGCPADSFETVPAYSNPECGQVAVELVKEERADFLMKGMIETRDIMKPLVDKENGLNTGRTMSMFTYNYVPQMTRLLALADGGMIPYPTLEQKKDIVMNCVESLHKLGIERPTVAILCGVEKVNPKMPETTDAAALVEMNRKGEIEGCDIYGPISFDIFMDKEIARLKGYDCPCAGDFDCCIVPSMAAGNLMHKAMIICGGTKMAGVIVGAKVPVVLSSRGASAEEKFVSMALASLLS